MTESAQKQLAMMKKIGKALRIVSLVLSLLAVVLLVMYLLTPAANLHLNFGDSKYAREGGYNYYGWQLSIFGCGYPPVPILAMFETTQLAGDYIPTAYDFNTNMTMIYALVLPILTLIVCGIVAGKMKNRGKAVCEFIVAAVFIYSAIILVNCVSLSIPMANNTGTTPFANNFLQPALAGQGSFTTCFYPIFNCVMLILFAVVKAGRGAFLIYQRSFALKNK